jgi:RNA polymerase sigma factor (sigma-70 family)
MPTAERQLATPVDPGAHLRTDDETLVRRMRAGDEGAFAAIFKRHQAPLLSYCRHMLGNQDEGEDALQQAFIKAHQALLDETAPRELRPWLYAIARNCCLSAIAARRPTAPLEDRTPALAGLADQVHQREDLRELVAAIGRLPEDQRSALLLAELDDLSHQAIAAILGCPVRRVKALVYQARSTLIADRNARNASCLDIREQISVAHGGELRRGPLRRHLNLCVGCRDFQLAVNVQRQSLAAVLPVLPSAGLVAAILGHGAAHTVGVASIGGAGAGLAPAGGAAGTSVGATAAGGTGIAATGTAATTAVGASAGAGAGGGTSVGALVGGGLVTKLAVGGTVVALAAAGAVTVHHRPAHAVPQRAPRLLADLRLVASSGAAGGRSVSAYVGSSGSSSSLGLGSPPGLALVNGTGPAAPAGPGPATELSGPGGARPLAIPAGAHPPSPVLSSIPAQPAGQAGHSAGDPSHHANAQATHRRTVRHRRQLRRTRHRQLRRTRHRRLRAASRRARLRTALRHHRLATPKQPKPLVAPAPVRAHRRKARPTLAPDTTSAPAGSPTAPGAGKEAKAGHRHPPASTGATGTGKGTGTATGTTGTGATAKTVSGAGTGTAGRSGAGTGTAGRSGAGTGTAGGSGAGTGAGKTGSGKGAGSAGTTTSKTKAGGGKTSGTGTGSTSGTGKAGEQNGAAAGGGATTGAGAAGSSSPGTKAHPKKHLLAEEQLPNF